MKMKLVAAATMGLAMSTAIAASDVTLSTDMDKLSYSIGADLGKNFKKQGIEINPTAMAKGLQDGMSGSQLMLTEDQMKEVLNNFQKDLMAKRNAEFSKNLKKTKQKVKPF